MLKETINLAWNDLYMTGYCALWMSLTVLRWWLGYKIITAAGKGTLYVIKKWKERIRTWKKRS